MIGNQRLVFSRPISYFYTGLPAVDIVPLAQPPTGGCYVRVEGAIGTGTITINGHSGGSVTSETISTVDVDGTGFGIKPWTEFHDFDITGFAGKTITIYPATLGGERIAFASSSTFSILCSHYRINETQFKGRFELPGGITHRSYREVQYDKRFNLLEGDTVTIDSKTYTVYSVDSLNNNVSAAFLVIKRL